MLSDGRIAAPCDGTYQSKKRSGGIGDEGDVGAPDVGESLPGRKSNLPVRSRNKPAQRKRFERIDSAGCGDEAGRKSNTKIRGFGFAGGRDQAVRL